MVVNKEGKIEMTPQELVDLLTKKEVIYYPTYPTYPTYPWVCYSISADGTRTVKHLDQGVINS